MKYALRCQKCRMSLHEEYEYAYILVKETWRKAIRRAQRKSTLPTGHSRRPSVYDYYCVGCIETQLGRVLTREDFDWNVPLNWFPGYGRSERLQDRMKA